MVFILMGRLYIQRKDHVGNKKTTCGLRGPRYWNMRVIVYDPSRPPCHLLSQKRASISTSFNQLPGLEHMHKGVMQYDHHPHFSKTAPATSINHKNHIPSTGTHPPSSLILGRPVANHATENSDNTRDGVAIT